MALGWMIKFWEHFNLLVQVFSLHYNPRLRQRMATISDAAKADGYMKSCTKLICFRTPICKPTLDFHASFKHSIGSPEAVALIQSLSEARTDLVTAYQSSSSYDVKIKCAEDYIPLLYRLLDSVNSAHKLQLDKELTFEWQGGITQKGEFFKSGDVLFELLMMFHAKVCCDVMVTTISHFACSSPYPDFQYRPCTMHSLLIISSLLTQ